MPDTELTYEPDDAPYRFTWDGGEYIEMYLTGREDPSAVIGAHNTAFTKSAMQARVDEWRQTHC